MVSNEYSIAYKEILEVLKHVPLDYFEKIPTKVTNLIINNANMDYEFSYDPKKTLDEQNISTCAKEILALIYTDFWGKGRTKEKILAFQKNQLAQIEKEKLEKYSADTIFKNNKTLNGVNAEEKQSTSIIEYKKIFFVKFVNYIKMLFKH